MDDEYVRSLIDSRFELPVVEGEDKVCSLQDAIGKHVEAGMSISFGGRGGALFYQLIREFWGRSPDFTVINNGISATMLALIHGKLAKRMIASFIGDVYPSPGPNPLVQKAYLSGEVEFENWTMLTVPQRLLAGAMGWGVTPTRSIAGSSMADENKDSFVVIEDPFAHGETIGLMKALRPDVALIHGVCADRCGNTLMTYPLGADVFGAWAARHGAIVSVEKIVSTDYIRKHSHLVRIPSYMVRAVCEVPYGAHPVGMTNCGLPEFEPYFEDYDFIIDATEASRNEEEFSEWINRWILEYRDHEQYLSKLGQDRLLGLKRKTDSSAWKDMVLGRIADSDLRRRPNSLEKMVIAAAHVVEDRFIAGGYKTLLAGVGLSNLAAWLAAYRLKERGHDVDLMAEIGMYGYLPRASDPFIFSQHNMPVCKILNNVETLLGVFVGGSSNQCMGVLAAGQIDRYGNVNSTKVPGVAYLVGSGGSNDIASSNRETVVVVNSGRQRLVAGVPYITFPGKRVTTVVTDVGVFEKGAEGTFILAAYIPVHPDESADEALGRIANRVGWELEAGSALRKLPPVTGEELTMLRLFDPDRFYIGQ
jgi:acyl CoA:acetate/3-ketoacid CoA transferase alpha subunit